MSAEDIVVTILDYGAGNVRSLRNAIKALGFKSKDVENAEDIANAEMIIFPGQGCFKQAVESLKVKGWFKPLQDYLRANRPFFGICLGMQLLFETSEESPGSEGLGLIPCSITRFGHEKGYGVPQIAWNGLKIVKESAVLADFRQNDMVYFVHSYCAKPSEKFLDWVLSITDYGSQRYVSMVQRGNIVAAQFHPEKSGVVGLNMLKNFIVSRGQLVSSNTASSSSGSGSINNNNNYNSGSMISRLEDIAALESTKLSKRVIACLDVRSNDDRDLVVTKGDQYEVRETLDNAETALRGRGGVRNLGKPVDLCRRYYAEGADEVVFLNITSFRQGVVEDLPMLQVLEAASEHVFVPLTVGGGVREYTDPTTNVKYSSLDVAGRYFRAGADKISIGSDAVYAAEQYLHSRCLTGQSAIEQISSHYGAQAVVVSIDPRRVYVEDPKAFEIEDDHGDTLVRRTVLPLREGESGPRGERFCWWQVTVKGGREARDLDAIQLAKISEVLGAGEIMLNCIDMDGQAQGYDIPLIRAVQKAVNIPVIASSGAGNAQHFVQVFQSTKVPAALAAGIFHRNEVSIQEVKQALLAENIVCRLT